MFAQIKTKVTSMHKEEFLHLLYLKHVTAVFFKVVYIFLSILIIFFFHIEIYYKYKTKI